METFLRKAFPVVPMLFPSTLELPPSELFACDIICTESAPLLDLDTLGQGSWVGICVSSTLESTSHLFETVETMNEDIENLKAVLLHIFWTIANSKKCILRYNLVMCPHSGKQTFMFVSHFTIHNAL